MTDPVPAGECDACGEVVPLEQLGRAIAYGIETSACCSCRGVDPPDEGEEEPDFECGICGGSGGGPEHWRCPTCFGTGTNLRARKSYFNERRTDV